MKSIANLSDRFAIYSIEAARFSFRMMESSFSDLQNLLDLLEHDSLTDAIALSIFKSTWLFIDTSFRFGRMLGQIRGLKHNAIEYKRVEKALVDLEKARNYIQHLNSEIPGLSAETYPILGALSWASKDKQRSFTIALGTLPPGTTFHSLSFDTASKEFVDEIELSIDTFSLNLTECNKLIRSGFEYLADWIESKGYSSTAEIQPNFAITTALNLGIASKRYVRVKVKFEINK